MAPTGLPPRNPQRRHQTPSDLEREIESNIRHLLRATDALSVMLMTSNQNAPPVTQQNQASGSTSQAASPMLQADDASSSSISSNYRKLADLSLPAAQPKPQAEDVSSSSVSSKHQISDSKSPAIQPKQQSEGASSSSAGSKPQRLSNSKSPTAYPKPQAQDGSSLSVSSKHRISVSKSSEAESKSRAEDASSSSVSSKQRFSGSISPPAQSQPQAEDSSPSTLSSKHRKRSSSTKPSHAQQKHKQPRRVQTRQPPYRYRSFGLPSYRSFDPVRTLFSSKGIKFIKKRQEQQERQLQNEQELIDIVLNHSADIARAGNPCRMLPGQLLVNHLQLKSTILRLEVLRTESRLQLTEPSHRNTLKLPPVSPSDKRSVTELESELFKLTRSPVCRRELQPEDEGVYKKTKKFVARPKGKVIERKAQAHNRPLTSADGSHEIATPACRKSKRATTSIVTADGPLMTSTPVKRESQSPTSVCSIDKEKLVESLSVSGSTIETSAQEPSSWSSCTYEPGPLTEDSSVLNPDDNSLPPRSHTFHCHVNNKTRPRSSSVQSKTRQGEGKK